MPGLTKFHVLNDYIADKSYIEGFEPSQADVVVFEALKGAPDAKFTYAARWYKHIASFGNARKSFAGEHKPLSAYGPAGEKDDEPAPEAAAPEVAAPEAAAPAAKKEEDDFDLFGDDEEEDEEAERVKAERVAAYNAKKATKPVVIAKSSVLFDIKPWDDETDMVAMEKAVRAIELEGLLWGASKLVPIVKGINKLQILCVIEDDKVSTDWLEEQITAIEDYVQSIDIAAFNKI